MPGELSRRGAVRRFEFENRRRRGFTAGRTGAGLIRNALEKEMDFLAHLRYQAVGLVIPR